VHLLRAIRDPRNTILIHVDSKASHLLGNDNKLQQEMDDCPCSDTIRITSKFDVQWSHWSMNLPTLWALEVAVTDYAGRWDVWINLSGDSLPVYTVDTMAETLVQLPYNFLTSSSCETNLVPTSVYHFPTWWHKRRHYTSDETEPDPIIRYQDSRGGEWKTKTLIPHFGSQWMILQADFCQWLVQELQRPESLANQFRAYLQASGKLMTDETFLPTLTMHVEAFQETLPRVNEKTGYLPWRNGTASSIQNIRFERMDEHHPTAFGVFSENQRYDVPETLSESNQLEVPRPWGPYFLGVYDLAHIRQSGALFVRKVTERIDPNMVSLLPVKHARDIPLIEWPPLLSLTEKPEWDEEYRTLYLEMVQRSSDVAEEQIIQEDEDEDEEL
jgi:hypothetical protein